jgi:ElaB/YqjD/DUF883 family membrane-anchored ribosome-binding protein
MNTTADTTHHRETARTSIDATRAEIRSFLRRNPSEDESEFGATRERTDAMPATVSGVVIDTVKRLAAEHPIAIVAEATAPVVREQIRAHPWKALAIGAAAGAALVAARPWRRLLLGSVIAGAVQPAAIKSMVAQGIHRFAENASRGNRPY